MIAIVDVGVGNLRSIHKACESSGLTTRLTSDADVIMAADGVILPGVGAFRSAYLALQGEGLLPVLAAYADSNRPLLGICVGMQLLFTHSEEGGLWPGLNLIAGLVTRFPHTGVTVPHMGWNTLGQTRGPLLEGLPPNPYMYFVHSYHAVPTFPANSIAIAIHGAPFTAAVQQHNIFGVQFHPEKSQELGLHIIRNFGKIVATPVPAPGASSSCAPGAASWCFP